MEHIQAGRIATLRSVSETSRVGARRIGVDDETSRFLAAVYEGLADSEAGRVVSDQELGVFLDGLFGPLTEDSEE